MEKLGFRFERETETRACRTCSTGQRLRAA